MSALRRLLGVLVMIAGILGIVISLAGLVFVWLVKPAVAGSIDTTMVTLNDSVATSQKAMEITGQALGATVDSVDALVDMLGATADSVEDTKPVLLQLNSFMGEELPTTLESATESLTTAQEAAVVLDSAIVSLDAFRFFLSATPFFAGTVEQSVEPYDPENSLADSLGDLAADLEALPPMFIEMAADLNQADDNLDTVQDSLTTMADSVGMISNSLGEYEAMVGQSQSSMDELKIMLGNIQANLTNTLNTVAIGISLFFLWLLAAQIVILSQGWELFQGTAGRMESEAQQTEAERS